MLTVSIFADTPPQFKPDHLANLPLPTNLLRAWSNRTTLATVTLTNAGDHFLMPGGKKISLLRAPDEIVVRYTNDTTPDRPAGLTAARRAHFRAHGHFEIISASANHQTPQSLNRHPGIRFAYPVLIEPKSHTRLLPTDELLLRLAPGVIPAVIAKDLAAAGVTIIEPTGAANLNTYRARLIKPKTTDPLTVARHLASHPKLRWAAPNFVRELRFHAIPNDPYFAQQQSLHNTGQNGAVPSADIHATAAWDISTGTNAITIAIIDEGVDTNHPDLTIAPGGWDFANNDPDPNPGPGQAHGTACAGIAAAIANNNTDTAGVAGGCRILPVKIADDTGAFTTDAIIGNAITFAATRADVLSNSWGGGDESPFINDAIDYAVTNGRAGKGCPIFFSTGNSASDWIAAALPISAIKDYFDTHSMTWPDQQYVAFGFMAGTNTTSEEFAKIDNVWFVGTNGYDHLTNLMPDQDFETWYWYFTDTGLYEAPLDWFPAGDAAWFPTNTDPFLGTGGSTSAQSPVLTTNQIAWFVTPLVALTGTETLYFETCLNVTTDSAFLIYFFDVTGTNGVGWNISSYSTLGTNSITAYPASYSNSTAVGASTDCDYRSDFSQYDGKIDFVAPGGGGWNNVVTLDITGTNGYSATDITTDFAGTSASCPHAAGIAALILSVNPNLTATEVRDLMRRTCDKIGGVTYTAGTNQFYGYGRLNAYSALAQLVPDLAVNLQATPAIANITSNLTYTITITNQGPVTATSVTVTNFLPATVTLLNATTTTGTCTNDPAGIILRNLDSLASNTAATITINVQLIDYNPLTNTVTVTFTEPDSVLSNNTAILITTVTLDSVGDGIPDWWRTQFFGAPGTNTNNLSCATCDPDGDGFTNIQEFNAGTDPTNTTSFLHIASATVSNAVFTITFDTVSNKLYRVQFTDDLITMPWTNLVEVSGTGQPLAVPDPGATNVPSRFYRIQLVPSL